jgi:tRNA(fMet)-specific endonuclease VapC
MAEENQRLIFLDSSVLIEYFRKTKKENSFFYKLQFEQGYMGFLFSSVVQIEIYEGVNNKQKDFWDNLFEDLIFVPITKKATEAAIKIQKELKLKRRKLTLGDLIIATAALTFKTPVATLNARHFLDIDDLSVVTPNSI